MYKLAILYFVLNLLSLAAQDAINNDRSHFLLKVTPDLGCFKERSSASIYCLKITNHITTFAHNVHWIKLTNDKFSRGRIWSYDYHLHFPSVTTSDEGSYCCRISQPLNNSADPSLHGCTDSTTARISIATPLQTNFLKNTSTIGSCMINSDNHVAARSLDDSKTWLISC